MLKCRPFVFQSFPSIPSLPSSLFSSLCKRSPRFSSPLPERGHPPKKIPFTVTAHGKSWDDPYHWMSNTDDPDLSDFLSRENSYAAAFMADAEPLCRRLYREMASRLPATISAPPEPWGPWLYYQYIPKNKEYPILCRRLENCTGITSTLFSFVRGLGKEEVLLDWNEVAEQFGYVHIGTCRVSPNHNFLAYTLDTTANESFALQVKDLSTGCLIQRSRIENVVSLAWSKDSSCLLYTISDETQRPYRVFCTKLDSNDLDCLLYTEKDSGYCVDITSTKDGTFITVNSNSRTSSEVYVIDAARPQNGLQCVRKRVPGVQYFLEHHHDFFYILTNAPLKEMRLDASGDYHIARSHAGSSPLAVWQDIILPSQDVVFEDMDMFNGHLVVFIRRKGIPMVCSISMPIDANWKNPMHLEALNPWFFPLPSDICSVVQGSNNDFMSHMYRVVVSSPVVPDLVVDYNMKDQTFSIVHQEEVPGIVNNSKSTSFIRKQHTDSPNIQAPSIPHVQNMQELQNWNNLSEAYSCERREVTSYDGARVPLTIVYSQRAWNNGQSPGLLQGYGAYGDVLDKSWCQAHLSLLDRGWVIAYADVRGGGGGGKSWHNAGTGTKKINSMHDFIACAMFLIGEGYVHKNQLCALGHSAGGLLVGATINMHPDLFCAAILKVPFLDICNTLLDPNLPLTVMDYDEFGDPRISNEFESIRNYSPYDNLRSSVCLPPMLVTASFYDSRVGVWEAAKWVAKVLENTCPACSHSVILKTNTSGGHFGEGGRFGEFEEAAFEYAFLIKVTGMLDEMQFE